MDCEFLTHSLSQDPADGGDEYLHINWVQDQAINVDFNPTLYDPDDQSIGCDHSQIHSGRGTVHSFSYQDVPLLLKQYRRGGMIRFVSQDQYIWRGFERTRAVRELRLLAKLYSQGLPVPRPVGCRIQRHQSGQSLSLPALYRAYLLSEYLPDCHGLHQRIKSESDSDCDKIKWQDIGQCLARFRRAGVFHADLNLSNILTDKSGNNYLIDFDRGRLMSHDSARYNRFASRMLQRLFRSMDKLEASDAEFRVSKLERDLLSDAFWA